MSGGHQDKAVDAREALAGCSLFMAFKAHDGAALLNRAQTRRYADGETIFQMGAPGDTLMALLSGAVRISITSAEGKELVLAILEPGDVFGEIAVLDGYERTADATAMGDCVLAVLERRDLMAFLQDHPAAWTDVVKVLCERLRRADEVLAEIALLQVPARLAKALLRVSKPITRSRGSATDIQLTQRELASLIGATRESVNKCLRSWHRAGIVNLDEGWISIQDELALSRLSELI